MSRRRLSIALAVWLLAAAAVVVLAAGGGSGVPLRAAPQVLPPAGWSSPTSELLTEDDGSRLRGRAADGAQFVWLSREPMDASSFRFLDLCIDRLGPEQRIVIAMGQGGQMHWLQVPRPWGARSSIDLGRSPAWQGQIDALGVVFAGVDYLPASVAPERSPRLCGAALRHDNLASRIDALWTRWFGQRPWVGRSINVSGLELGEGQSADFLPWWAGLSALGLLLAAWAARGPALIGGVLLATLALPAGNEVLQQLARARAAGVAQQAASAKGITLTALPAWADEIAALEPAIESVAPSRVLVVASSGFAREYPVWLLRRFNAAGIEPGWMPDPHRLGAEGSVLLLPKGDGWELDAAGGVARREGLSLGVRVLGQGPSWVVLQLRVGAGP